MSKDKYEDIVRKCYADILKRQPDEEGFKHYLKLLQNRTGHQFCLRRYWMV